MSETVEGLGKMLRKWKEAFESKGLKVNLGKTNVMVNSGIAGDDLFIYLSICGLCLESKG